MRRWHCFAAITAFALVAGPAATAGERLDRDRIRRAIGLLPTVTIPWIGPVTMNASLDVGGEWTGADIETLKARTMGSARAFGALFDLARAYRFLGDADHERECRTRAISGMRKDLDGLPADGFLLGTLALQLAAAGDDKAADETLRRATSAQSVPSGGWAASGDLAFTRAVSALAETRLADADEACFLLRFQTQRPKSLPTDAVRLLSEAEASYDKAVQHAAEDAASIPSNPAWESCMLFKRGMFRTYRAIYGLADSSGADGRASQRAAGLADVQKASDLAPRDSRFAAFGYRAFALRPVGDPKYPEARMPEEMSETERGKAEALLDRLRGLSRDSDVSTSVAAMRCLGAVEYLFRARPAAAETAFRQAIARSPADDRTWNQVVRILAADGRWNDLVVLMHDWLKTGDTAWKHVLLAKAEQRLGHAADEETQWKTAAELDPSGYAPNLGLAVALLRNAPKAPDAERIKQLLEAAAAAFRDTSVADRGRDCELRLALSALLALTGDPDDAAARARQVVELDANNDIAREILGAIGR